MRYQIGEHGIGGRDESWYYVEFNEGTGEAFWIHEWDNLNHRFESSSGETRLPLAEASGKSFYSEALKVLSENHPEWKRP